MKMSVKGKKKIILNLESYEELKKVRDEKAPGWH
jgi:hypothetical protein